MEEGEGLGTRLCVASNPDLLPPPRAHAPCVLIMRRCFFGGRRPGFEASYVCVRTTTCVCACVRVCGPRAEASSFVPAVPTAAALLRCGMGQKNGCLQRGDRGGYDCEFVKPPPATSQTVCPVCLHILKEPCVISCPCGQKICRECVEQIKKSRKPCPMCNKAEFTIVRDNGLESKKDYYDVHCSSKKDGCEWRENLGEYGQHLNQNPSPENQLTGCQFVEVDCDHRCGERFQRCHIISHQNKQYRKQPYSCEYCRDCDSTFEDITEIHHPKCKKYSVVCSNGCQDDSLERQELENQEVRHNLEYLQKNTEVDLILKKEMFSLQLTLGGFPLVFHVKFEVEKYRINLPAFYTHPNGYKMNIYLYPNGYGSGEGSHVSISTHLIQGSYDDHLKWPFRGSITIQIVNQAGDHSHVEKTIRFDKTAGVNANRVTGNVRSGKSKFLAHTDLVSYTGKKNTQYLKDDIIIVRVVRVKITQ